MMPIVYAMATIAAAVVMPFLLAAEDILMLTAILFFAVGESNSLKRRSSKS